MNEVRRLGQAVPATLIVEAFDRGYIKSEQAWEMCGNEAQEFGVDPRDMSQGQRGETSGTKEVRDTRGMAGLGHQTKCFKADG
jgi:hypothetical protein